MKKTYDIVFRGGGIKGIAFVGALETLTGDKWQTRRLIGTSAGAIFAAAHAAGYAPAEMEERIKKRVDGRLVFDSFLQKAHRPSAIPELLWNPASAAADNAFRRLAKIIPGMNENQTAGWGGKSLSLALGGAVCDDSAFRDWMAGLLSDKKFDPAISLLECHKFINKERPAQLSLVATDITDQRLLVLNERTAPKLPVLEAVRMSMGIPFVWKETIWRESWGTYRGDDVTGHSLADGGLLSNFPMRYLLDPKHVSKDGELGPMPGEAVKTLGLSLDGRKPMPDLPDLTESRYLIERLPVVRLASQLLDTLTEAWDREALREHVSAEREKRLLCRIGVRGVGHLDFNLPAVQLDALLNSGRCAMREFLDFQAKNP